MSLPEVEAILKSVFEEYKDNWEQTRFITFVNAASSGAKVKSPTDIMKFSWETSEEETQEPTEQQRLQSQYDLINAFNSPDKQVFKP